MKIKIWKNWPMKYKIALNLAAVILIAGGLSFLSFVTIAKKIKTARLEIFAQRQQVEKIYEEVRTLKKTKKQLNDNEDNIKKIENIFIRSDQELEFITGLESLAAKHNIGQKINLGQKEVLPKTIFAKSGLNISAQGKFPSLADYLRDLNSLNYYLIIRQISFSAGGDNSAGAGDYLKTPAAAIADKKIGQEKNLLLSIEADAYWLEQNLFISHQ